MLNISDAKGGGDGLAGPGGENDVDGKTIWEGGMGGLSLESGLQPGAARPISGGRSDPKARALHLIDDDRLLQAARVVRESGVALTAPHGEDTGPSAHAPDEPSADEAKLRRFMAKASLMETLLASLKSAPDSISGWLVQGEHMVSPEPFSHRS